eukprot:9444938-Pyramimonas_sp.AAC.1
MSAFALVASICATRFARAFIDLLTVSKTEGTCSSPGSAAPNVGGAVGVAPAGPARRLPSSSASFAGGRGSGPVP